MAGTPDATPSSFFNVTGCADPPPFDPGFVAGTVTPQAGEVQLVHAEPVAPGPRTVRQGHPGAHAAGAAGDALERAAVRRTASRPRHVSGNASKIGTTRVASGAGSHPFEIEGNVYLTGPTVARRSV